MFVRPEHARSFDGSRTANMTRSKLNILISGVTILLSLTVFLNLVAEKIPTTSDAVPLIGMPAGRIVCYMAPVLLFNCPLILGGRQIDIRWNILLYTKNTSLIYVDDFFVGLMLFSTIWPDNNLVVQWSATHNAGFQTDLKNGCSIIKKLPQQTKRELSQVNK